MTRRFLCALTARLTRATTVLLAVVVPAAGPGRASAAARRRYGEEAAVTGERSAPEQPVDLLGIALGQGDVEGETSGAGGRLVLEEVAAVRLLTHELAGAGDPEPLLGAAVRLHLG